MKETTWLKITPRQIESNDLDFESAFELLLSALRQYALTLVSAHPEAKEEVYDWINQGVSGILHEIDPTSDPNPQLDINEVIAKQDLYIHEHLTQLKTKNPRLYKKSLKAVKQQQSDQRAKILDLRQKNNIVTPLGDLDPRQIRIDELPPCQKQ